MAKPYDLLSLGSLYLDINCMSFPFGEGLRPETETIGRDYQAAAGGSAVISATVAAQLGMKPVFIGKVGNDVLGQAAQALLNKAGITPRLITDDSVQTNLGLNYTNESGRTLMTVVGSANQSLEAEEIIAHLETMLPEVSYLYLGGYFKLTTLAPYYSDVIAKAHQNGVKVVIDHGRVNDSVTSSQKEHLRSLVAQADYYFPSEDECFAVWEETEVEAALKKVRTHTTATVALKRADKGAMSITADGEFITVAAKPVQVLNAVGAGDSFNAGFLFAQTQSRSLLQSLQSGCATAALRISGETVSVARLYEIL